MKPFPKIKMIVMPLPISLAVVALTIAIPASLAGQVPARPTVGGLTIRSGERSVELTATDLAALPRRTVHIGEGVETETLSGVDLWAVLQRAGAVPAAASGRQRAVTYIRLVGADGQNAVLALVEFDPSFSRRFVLLADQRGGRPLDPVEGPWRAIVPDDLRHARWIRGLVTISVEVLK